MTSSNPKLSITDLLSAFQWSLELESLSRKLLTSHASDQLCRVYSKDQALIACELASSRDLATEASQTLWQLMQHYEPSMRVGAVRTWVMMVYRCSNVFVKETTTDYFLNGVREVIETDFDGGLRRRRLLRDISEVVDKYSMRDESCPLYKFWLDIQPDKMSSPGAGPPDLGRRSRVPSLGTNDFESFYRYQPTSPSTPTSNNSDASPSIGHGRSSSEYSLPESSRRAPRKAEKPLNPIVERVSGLDESEPSSARPNRALSLPNPTHPSVPMLPMRVSWTNSTTSGYAPSEQWRNRDPPTLSPVSSYVPWKPPLMPSSQPPPPLSSVPNLAPSLTALRGSRALLNLSIADFCAQVVGEASDSSLGRVHTLLRAKSPGFVPHDYLMLGISTSDGGSLWARLDRRPSERGSFLLSTSTIANDSVNAVIRRRRSLLTL